MRGLRQLTRDRISLIGTILFLSALSFALAVWWIKPAPPRSITLATGAPGGAYERWGDAYRDALDDIGIEVVLEPSAGAVENLRMLESGKVDVAFLQSGLPTNDTENEIEALATLAPEPAWIFVSTGIGSLRELRGHDIAGGNDGSGTLAFTRQLVTITGQEGATRVLPIGGEAAADAFQAGEVDAVVMISAVANTAISRLLQDKEARLLSVEDAAGLSRQNPWLSSAELFAGSIDYGKRIPRNTHLLLSTNALLSARSDLHPAVVDALLETAMQINREHGLFAAQGEYPQKPQASLPISDDALRYFDDGPTLLRRFLPFWVASFVERTWVLVLPLLTVMFPLFRIAPPTYRWQIKRRINRQYLRLQAIEKQLEAPVISPSEAKQLARKVAELEEIAAHISVPAGFISDLYHLRRHIAIVRERIETTGSDVTDDFQDAQPLHDVRH